MSGGTLYTYPGNFRAYKILVAAQYSGATVKTVSDPPEFVFGETNKTNDFLKKFPLGKVPAFETSDGKNIFESNAIAHYVGNEQLRGQNVADQTSILQWINFADNEILPASCTWVFPILGIRPFIKKDADRAKEDVTKALALLNDHLLTRTFLVGERITQADITVSCNLLHLYEHVLDAATREPFANTNRWFTTVIGQPQFKAVVGEFKICEKMAEFDAKKFAEFQGKTGKETKDKKEKSPKPGKSGDEAPAKVKESKQKGKDAKSEDPPEELDETEQILAAESSSSDPFDQLPKGTFDINDFKRVYSNEPETVSVPYFWEKLDKENYSIWHCEYKYPEDLTLVFMSCNLISGLYQRLDKMRKQSFGSMILFGKDNESSISGVWVWRGQGLAFELSPDWQVDYEHYNWKKLDTNSVEDQKIVNEYFSWYGDFGGKTFNQGKIFK